MARTRISVYIDAHNLDRLKALGPNVSITIDNILAVTQKVAPNPKLPIKVPTSATLSQDSIEFVRHVADSNEVSFNQALIFMLDAYLESVSAK